MIRYNKSVIEQQLLSSDPVNNCILLLSLCIQLDITIFTERICKKELAPHVDILSEGKMTLSHNCKVEVNISKIFLKRIYIL